MQQKFKLERVNHQLMAQLNANPDSQYFAAMNFQLGCAIGELMGMGVSANDILAACQHLVSLVERERQPAPVEPPRSIIIQ